MNIDTHTHVVAPSSPYDLSTRYEQRLMGQILPPLFKTHGSLANIPQATLRQNLQPVFRALGKLNAELLLDLHPAERGPRVREG
jgi:hypothetical protein